MASRVTPYTQGDQPAGACLLPPAAQPWAEPTRTDDGMTWYATMRAMEAAGKRQQRDAKKRQRELERQAKEMAKLSALDQARVEVETYENALDVLLSVHKEQVAPLDWLDLGASLPPVPPRRQSHNELKARQRLAVAPSRPDAVTAINQARQQDDREYQEALQTHALERAEWEKISSLAHRVLRGDPGAYFEAIAELSPFAELATIGSSIHFTVHSPRMVESVSAPTVVRPSLLKSNRSPHRARSRSNPCRGCASRGSTKTTSAGVSCVWPANSSHSCRLRHS